MAGSIEALEQRIDTLHAEVRQAVMSGQRGRAQTLRRDLHAAERAWDDALAWVEAAVPDVSGTTHAPGPPVRTTASETALPGGSGAARPAGRLLPVREQVHQALTLLTVPAALRLIAMVHEAFFAGPIVGARLTSLRRDEERSFQSAPFARPYYVCGALTADLLAPVRGLLAISTWPMERRVIGPLSPRVDYLTAAVQIAESVQRIPRPGTAAWRLLWRFAANIPGGSPPAGEVDPSAVAEAARAEMAVHARTDAATRSAAGARARHQLGDVEQLFGSRLRAAPPPSAGVKG